MRPYHAAVLLILLLSITLANLPSSTAASGSNYTAKVSRSVWLFPYFTQVKDIVLVNNTSSGIVSYIDFKITSHEYASLFSMSATDSAGQALPITLQGAPLQDFSFYRITLTTPIPKNQTSIITINRYLLFYDTSFIEASTTVNLTISISPTILLLNPIFKANFTAYLPASESSFSFTPASYTLSNVTFKFTKNASAHSINGNLTKIPQPDALQPIAISFGGDAGGASATNEVYITSAQTTINVGDTVTASSMFTVYNARGGGNIGKTSTLYFVMPSSVQKDTVSASDFTGDLPNVRTDQAAGNSPVNVTVPTRFDINRTQTYQFTLNYNLNPSVLIKSGDKYSVNLTSLSPYIPFTINLQVRLVTPYGATSLSSKQTPTAQGNQGGAYFTEFDTVNSSAYIAQSIQASFNYAGYWGFIRPWAYAGFIYLVGLAFVAVYLRQKPVSVQAAPEVVSDLTKFCDLYDDKTALGLEAQGLDESLRRGKLAKPLYDKRLQEIETRRINLDRQLAELSRSIRSSAPRYSKSLDQVELLEAEHRTVTATIKDLQRQYAARKVSRRVYEDLMYTYEGRLRKIQSRIDSLIINLREGRL
jgi:hypothetical protein